MDSPGTGAEDVNEFLQRIRELGDKRDREDNERAKKLEAEIIAGREARRARRDERARSISPQKTGSSPATSLKSPVADIVKDAPQLESTPAPRPALSWQRRPKSSYGLSSTMTDKSREEIAASLETKEPAWFRQSAERNKSSRALRKAEDEGMDTEKMALPGMGTPEPEKRPLPVPEPKKRPLPIPEPEKRQLPPPPESEKLTLEASPSLTRSIFFESATSRHARSTSVNSNVSEKLDLGELMRPSPMSPSQGRMSPERRERTPSPTKGLGGFVQSAMLKREGSINKRWSNSQQPGHGPMSRNNSAATTRPAFGRDARGSFSSGLSREGSPALEDFPINEPSRSEDTESFTRGRTPSAAESIASAATVGRGQRDSSPPASPTKTFEQKRWSPTKSSWLESALKKGDQTQAPPPMKPLKPVDLTPVKPRERQSESTPFVRPATKPKPSTLPSKPSETPVVELPAAQPEKLTTQKPATPPKPEKPANLNRASIEPSPLARRSPSPEKFADLARKPLSPTKSAIDFRANLKPRGSVDKGDGNHTPEFLNAMAKLRATKTQNYKAPNELKELILGGKANLNTTGGPQKTDRPNELKEQVLSAKASLRQSSPERSPERSPTRAAPVELPQILPQQVPILAPTKVGGSARANRFNPGLANLLQRRPPGTGPARPKDENGNSPGRGSGTSADEPQSSGPLNHMTKARARGPKRRAPTRAEATPVRSETAPPSSSSQEPAPRPLPIRPATVSTIDKPLQSAPVVRDLPSIPQKLDKPKPVTPAKSPLLRGNSDLSIKDSKDPIAEVKTPPPIRSPSTNALKKMPSREVSPAPTSPAPLRVLGATAKDGSESDFTPTRVKESPRVWMRPEANPLATPTKSLEVMKNGRGLGLSGMNSSPSVTPSRPLPKPPSRSPSPSPQPVTQVADFQPMWDDVDNTKLLSEFFKGPFLRAEHWEFDIIGLLSSSPVVPPQKVRTLKMEVSQVKGHGKLGRIPQELESVFFEEALYLCVHQFEKRSGAVPESVVYLWSGSKVSESAVEDAQLFARKTARDCDGKLVKIRQGRETPEFLQGIGGIFITRRGLHGRGLTGDFMLCGRRLSGSMAFDEVDMKPASLCSGFPFLVSYRGRGYLWKGKGATSEEISVARHLGSQISGAEPMEISEGDEPDALYDALKGEDLLPSADYWHLRPSCRKYAARLFKVDLEARHKITEIHPFSQADLDPREIYIADAFFEFYIVIGAQSQQKREEFQIALQFTSEYAMLAVSIEDRPFMPVSSVILGGAPREFKALFRHWEDERSPTTNLLSRKRSIRIVALEEAVVAMQGR